jgi:hypothetical protein
MSNETTPKKAPTTRPAKIKPGDHFIRRRDKTLVYVNKTSGRGIEYVTKPLLLVTTVTLEGFRKGFRPLNDEEKKRHAESIADTAGLPGFSDK